MKSIKGIIAVTAFSLIVLALPSVASAQWRDRGGYNDPYGRNGGYNNGNYGANIRGTIQALKNRARNFERTTNRVDDRRDNRGGWGNRGGWYGNGNVGQIENLADDFKKATDRLESRFGNGRNLNNSQNEARRVLDIGYRIDQELRRTRGSQVLLREWSMIRRDLDVVASVYGQGYNNNRNRPGTYNRNDDWRNRIPFPLPF